jgi:hypothetical protein
MSAAWQVPQLTSNTVLQQLLRSGVHGQGHAPFGNSGRWSDPPMDCNRQSRPCLWGCPGWVSQAHGRGSAIAPRPSTPGFAAVGSLICGFLTSTLPQYHVGDVECRRVNIFPALEQAVSRCGMHRAYSAYGSFRMSTMRDFFSSLTRKWMRSPTLRPLIWAGSDTLKGISIGPMK